MDAELFPGVTLEAGVEPGLDGRQGGRSQRQKADLLLPAAVQDEQGAATRRLPVQGAAERAQRDAL